MAMGRCVLMYCKYVGLWHVFAYCWVGLHLTYLLRLSCLSVPVNTESNTSLSSQVFFFILGGGWVITSLGMYVGDQDGEITDYVELEARS